MVGDLVGDGNTAGLILQGNRNTQGNTS